MTSRANPLAKGPLVSRADVQRSVRDLYEPLLPHTSSSGARVRLGSFSAAFPDRVAELEGFARPLYGIVPLTVGGGGFEHWDRFASGLDAGTDPAHADYWGPVGGPSDQRMVEQAAIGLALAFCPERMWEPLGTDARRRVSTWLQGIFEYEPAPNNWQFFRVLVALGLQRVGERVDDEAVASSLSLLESYRRGDHWYIDGQIGNVDYYIPFAFHTYGLMYAAAADIGLGDPAQAERYRERAAGFAADFRHWFAPDGAAIPFGRSLTYRFAMSSFWGALAWADVESIPWGEVRGLSLRHLRWWAERPISDRDGVLSVGFAYDNRRLAEGYNSAGSPYWCMKAFGGLAAPADHPFWTTDELPLAPLEAPVLLDEAGWVVDRDDHQAIALVGVPSPPFRFMEQGDAKYRKFVYSSAFGFSGDVEPMFGPMTTDSMLAFSDQEGNRRIRSSVQAAGVVDAMAWSTWHPWPDVRVDSVVWGGVPWHGRMHRVRTARPLTAEETGFALGHEPERIGGATPARASNPGEAVLVTPAGCSAIVDLDGERTATTRSLPTNANLLRSQTMVPILAGALEPGDHRLSALVFASPGAVSLPEQRPAVPEAAFRLLEHISAQESSAGTAGIDLMALLTANRKRD